MLRLYLDTLQWNNIANGVATCNNKSCFKALKVKQQQQQLQQQQQQQQQRWRRRRRQQQHAKKLANLVKRGIRTRDERPMC